MVEKNPAVTDFRSILARGNLNLGVLQAQMGRTTELSDRAVELQAPVLTDQPENIDFRLGQGQSLLRSGLARRDRGDLAGAVARWRQATRLFEEVQAMSPDSAFFHACCHTVLSWAAGPPGSRVSAGEAETELTRAMGLLQRRRKEACATRQSTAPSLP